ncbi:conjugative transposon protein TraM [Dinghuibacter silviterrae]|uniref:Conjugative transposon TraM protein n=1 Tax=Dinghuibacter silviterrae TaxID=1539049 RepID=A0A4R8DQT2_9BACT|nr:conjugative transposon protein TraM [Dinghuibacter silviterrae]TDX00512.1 conjugative transposon TraM protein [Dinghuibacter silviterrae]
MNTYSEKEKRQRKGLLLLPLVGFAFATLVFWALGGGVGKAGAGNALQQGFNTSVPAAKLPNTFMDKLSLYNKAAQDSLALNEQLTGGLFAKADSLTDTVGRKSDFVPSRAGNLPSFTGEHSYSDRNEEKVREKLAQLEKSLDQPLPQQAEVSPAMSDQATLEKIMQQENKAVTPDTQMQQLSGMLEKILDIEHPERVQERIQELSFRNRGRVYSLGTIPQDEKAVLLGDMPDTGNGSSRPVSLRGPQENGFYDLDQAVADTGLPLAIPAVVEETQTVTSGMNLKLRITQDVYISGMLVPRNTFVTGVCAVDGERLKVSIPGVRYRDALFPVALSVYDLDALEGIRVPGAITRDASKEGADQVVQSLQLMNMDPSLGTQAASAGIEAAKGLFSKKVKLVRVTVKAGYPVLLVDDKSRRETN